MSNVSFEIAEVVSGYNNTYTNPDENAKENIKPYSIRVRIINTTNSRDRNTRTAIPYDINNVQIPLLGEQVLLIQGQKEVVNMMTLVINGTIFHHLVLIVLAILIQ